MIALESSALAADSDKSRGIFWECILSSKYEFSCYYLEESMFEMEMTYLFMRLMCCLSCIFVFTALIFLIISADFTRCYEGRARKKAIFRVVSTINYVTDVRVFSSDVWITDNNSRWSYRHGLHLVLYFDPRAPWARSRRRCVPRAYCWTSARAGPGERASWRRTMKKTRSRGGSSPACS